MKKDCLNCQNVVSATMDGETSDAEKSRMFFHLSKCPDCRAFWDSLTSIKLETASLDRHNMPEGAEGAKRAFQDIVGHSTRKITHPDAPRIQPLHAQRRSADAFSKRLEDNELVGKYLSSVAQFFASIVVGFILFIFLLFVSGQTTSQDSVQDDFLPSPVSAGSPIR